MKQKKKNSQHCYCNDPEFQPNWVIKELRCEHAMSNKIERLPFYAKERIHIKNFRNNMGLRKLRYGKRQCLRCEIEFESEDVVNNRMCPSCRKRIIT